MIEIITHLVRGYFRDHKCCHYQTHINLYETHMRFICVFFSSFVLGLARPQLPETVDWSHNGCAVDGHT